MSAAQAVLVETQSYVETPSYIEASSMAPGSRDTICDLVHELRQPLSSMEAIAYYLEMTLPPEQVEARQYMLRLQQLVDQAESILKRAGSSVRKPVGSVHAAGR
jgi:phosphoglycerate-specific signal transduction histidine kinase